MADAQQIGLREGDLIIQVNRVPVETAEEAATAFEGKSGRVSAVTTTGRTLPAELVVLATGVRPNAELAAGAGLQMAAETAAA